MPLGERTEPRVTSLGAMVARTVDGNGVPTVQQQRCYRLLGNEDWDEINDLLSRQKPGGSRFCLDASGNRVTSSVAELRLSIGQQIVPSGPVLDRLLTCRPSCTRLTPRQQDPWSRCSLLGRPRLGERQGSH